MSELFLSVLNMSLTASYVILFVILVRQVLKKSPKFISYVLWIVVALRLIIPFSFESMFSLMPRNTNTAPIPHDIIYQKSPQINTGIETVDSFVNQSLPAPTTVGASANPLQIYAEIGAYIWILGIVALLVYSFVSILSLYKQLKRAQLIEKNIFEANNLKTPFVLGLVRPKIYLPVGLSATERSYILLHEQTHIHRKDHIIKILAFLILSIHWFNPLVWVAFILMSKDMELSCDERVLKEMDEDIIKPYANSLLSLATGKHILNGSPLAFGEGNVKGRIKNVLNYRKPKFWIMVISIIIVLAVSIGLITNPKSDTDINSNNKGNDNELSSEVNVSKDNNQDEQDVLILIEVFGEQLKKVSLSAPKDVISTSIEENYSDYVTSELLQKWQDNPQSAPGRTVSSPWPEGIDILRMEMENKHQYTVYGNIVEVTGDEFKKGEIAAKRAVEMVIKKVNDDWFISSMEIGEYVQYDGDAYENQEKILQPTAPELSLDQSLGVGMPELDYASDDIVIFHSYFGLFVYDLNTLQIIRSIDLKPLNCHYTQGSNACEVMVSEDGDTVYLHPRESKNMYIYTVSSHTLQEKPYQQMEKRFRGVPIEDVIDSTKLGTYSYNAASFDNGEYGYLHASDWTIATLSYVRGDMVYALFEKTENMEAYKMKLDGYLADVTDIQDSYVDEIYVWGDVTLLSGFGKEKYFPLLEMKNNEVIRDILNIINDKSL